MERQFTYWEIISALAEMFAGKDMEHILGKTKEELSDYVWNNQFEAISEDIIEKLMFLQKRRED